MRIGLQRMELRLTILLLSFAFLLCGSQSLRKSLDRRKNGELSSCEVMYKETNDVWLLGETIPGSSFAAQLLAIYSYVPVSFVFGADLVVSNLWTRLYMMNKNDTARMTKIVPQSFSTFFDYNHFITYWSRHKRKIISLKVYNNCFFHKSLNDSNTTTSLQRSQHDRSKLQFKDMKTYSRKFYHDITVIRRIPEFYPYERREFCKLFYFSNITTLPHFQFPFKPHQHIRIESRYRMTGLYSFWNDSTMLSYAYSSVKPAIPIEKIAHAIEHILPKPMIAIHLRVDDTAFDRLSKKFKEYLYEKLLASVLESPCFNDYVNISHSENETTYEIIKQPTVYISMNFQPDLKGAQVRKQRIIQSFLNIGFYGIYNNDRMYYLFLEQQRKIKEGQHPEKSELNDHITSLSLMQSLSPEQLSYVDMIVSRSSACFVPSVVPSLHSYMTARMRSLDGKVFEKYEDINVSSYGPMYFYRDWGF